MTSNVPGVIPDPTSVVITGGGTVVLQAVNTYSGGTTICGATALNPSCGISPAASTLQISRDTSIGTGPLVFDGGRLQSAGFLAERNLSNEIQITANGGVIDVGSGFFRLTGNMIDAPGSAGGTLTIESLTAGPERLAILSGNNTYSGITSVVSGTVITNSTTALSRNSAFQINTGATVTLSGFSNTIVSLADGVGGGGVVQNASVGGTAVLTLTGAQGGTSSFSGVLRDGTGGEGGGGGPVLALVKNGASTQILAGINHYTGATTVNGGTLQVDGSIAPSSMTTVNANGVLTGIGTVGNTTVASGGTLMPGTATTPGSLLSVTGNLALQSGALYLVMVTPAASTSTQVSGAASLNGLLGGSFAAGSYASKQYNILHAAGGVTGTFSGFQSLGLPAGFTTSISYDANNAYLNLVLNFSGTNYGGGLNINQQNVANALTNFFNATGGIPMVFGTLTPAGLTQVSGETATGSLQTTFDAMSLFMGLLTDPFMNRNGGAGAAPAVSGYAATSRPTDAFAMFTKAPPAAFQQRWSTWIAGYGGSQSTSGNAALGSNDTTSNVAGTAVGADYLLSPNTIAGFAIAGGGTSFSVANGGSGRSDLFQVGAYVRHNAGPAYISAALAYGWQDITTNRTVTVAGADQLRAEFNANAWSGRLEGGYRFVSPATLGVGITPYAAAQVVTFGLPSYAEQAIVGNNTFALSYGARNATDPRSELGVRADRSWAMNDGILTLRGRLAWAHDYDPNRAIASTFQTLPGASFVVNGAAQAADSALTTASIGMNWRNGWSAATTFEGEFSNVTSSYAGKGIVRYQW